MLPLEIGFGLVATVMGFMLPTLAGLPCTLVKDISPLSVIMGGLIGMVYSMAADPAVQTGGTWLALRGFSLVPAGGLLGAQARWVSAPIEVATDALPVGAVTWETGLTALRGIGCVKLSSAVLVFGVELPTVAALAAVLTSPSSSPLASHPSSSSSS